VWFRENVRGHLAGWRAIEATLCFRFFNRIETGIAVKDLLLGGWNRDEAYVRLSALPGPLWTGAYRIRGENGKPKLESTLDSIEAARRRLPGLSRFWGDTLREAHEDLCRLPFLGTFMAYEIVSDLRWTPVLAGARDVNSWAAAGPGCASGLGFVVAGDVKRYSYYSQRDQRDMLSVLRDLLAMSRNPMYWPYSDTQWELREAEHWACEVAKWVRYRDGGAPPRQRYVATARNAA
jgi:hypothetical protein